MGLRYYLLAGSALALVSAPAALAQTAPVNTAASTLAATTIGEVVVTARKREERLKDVPIAVTAVTPETIERQQINQVKDIAAFAPGLTINSDSVGRSFVSIRGVGTTLIDTVQTGVGIFIDGVYEPNTSYLNSPLLDVERIEVLRGPQGTLFGSNTLGGAINVITRQPSDTFHASLSGAYAGPDNYGSAAASISGPIVPGVLHARVGVSYHTQDGFEKNTLAGGNANPLDQRSVDGTLRFEPAPWAVFTLNPYYDRVRGGTTAYIDLTGPKDYSENATLNVNSIATYTYKGGNLKGEFEVPQARTKITLVGAYDQKDGVADGDGDFGPIDFLRVHGFNTLKTTTGEVRFDTKFNDHISSLIGFFADRSVTDTTVLTTIVPFGVVSPSFQRNELAAQAVYGTLFFKLGDTVELTTGLRYDHQHVTASNAVDPVTHELIPFRANELEPRFTLTKHWTPDVMTYLSVSRGYRGGGANPPGSPNPIYNGDSVWTYEAGTKVETDDHRLSLDADVFYNDYRNFIGQNSLAPSTIGPGFVAINLNTGTVQSYGAELEAQFRPTQRWALSAGLTLLHARITDGSEYVATTGMPLPSDRILFTPDWNFFANADYSLPVGADTVRFDATLIGKGSRIGSTLTPASVPVLDPYYLVNASVAYVHGPIEVALFATNLFNEKYLESYLDASLLSTAGFPPPLVHNLGIQGDRARYGIRAKYAF